MRLAVVATLVLLAVPGLAADIAYTGCLKSSDGSLYYVREGTTPMAPCQKKDTQISWNMAGPPGPAGSLNRVLTEIGLISVLRGFNSGNGGEITRFLWEPDRYDPAPIELFLEIYGSVSGSATFRLYDVTHGSDIEGSSMVVSDGVRVRSENLAFSFPSEPAEIALVVDLGQGSSFSIQRSAVLIVQQ